MGLEDLSTWSGNIDEFARKAAEMTVRVGLPDEGEPTIRMIRDYLQRGILGSTGKSGREIVFGYVNLLRYLAARVLLRDGWPLSKISQHFDISTQVELEAIVPGLANRAIAALRRIKQGSVSAGANFEPKRTFSHRAARISGIHTERLEAMRRLGLPPDKVTTELTMIVLATWCQVLVESDRLKHITEAEAEEVGRVLTASLLNNATKRGGRK